MEKRPLYCLLVLGLAGLLFAFGDLLIPQENVLFEAVQRPREFARLVTSGNYTLWALRGFVGVLMEMIGTLGLYLYLQNTKAERLAFAGLVFTLTHQILGLGVFALAYFMFPALGELYLKGNHSAVTFAAIEGPLAIFFALSLITTLIGLGLMALAVQRSGVLPKWSGWLAFLGFFLIPFPGVVLQFTTNITWAFAYCWMAWHIAKKSKAVVNSPAVEGAAAVQTI